MKWEEIDARQTDSIRQIEELGKRARGFKCLIKLSRDLVEYCYGGSYDITINVLMIAHSE